MAKAKKIDFSGVDKEIRKGGGKAAHVPEGNYLVKIIEGELRKSQKEGGGRYYNWRLQVVKPKQFSGRTLYLTTSLKPDALWNLRNLIYAALGKNVAGKSVTFDPDKLRNKVVACTCTDDEYEKDGKTVMKSNVDDVRPKDELEIGDDDEEEDEEDGEEEETEEDDDEEDEELEEVDTDEL